MKDSKKIFPRGTTLKCSERGSEKVSLGPAVALDRPESKPSNDRTPLAMGLSLWYRRSSQISSSLWPAVICVLWSGVPQKSQKQFFEPVVDLRWPLDGCVWPNCVSASVVVPSHWPTGGACENSSLARSHQRQKSPPANSGLCYWSEFFRTFFCFPHLLLYHDCECYTECKLLLVDLFNIQRISSFSYKHCPVLIYLAIQHWWSWAFLLL